MARWIDRTWGDLVGDYFGILLRDKPPTRPKPRQRGQFKLTVYDKDLHRVGWVGSYISLKVYPRHNAVGSAELVLPATHVEVPNLMARGSRLVIDYDGKFLMSGWVRGRVGEGPANVSTATFRLVDDLQVLWDVLGWPNPDGAINDQGAVTKYSTVTGPAETVVKRFVQLNAVDRLAVPHLRVAADQGRGSTIQVKMRMDPLGEKLFPAVDLAGIGVTVQQIDGDIVVDCFEPVTHTRPLTEESGTVSAWSWSWDDPTASRGVLGGGGEGTEREFRIATDPTREATWGMVREAFFDARDLGTDYESAIKDVPEKLTDLREKNRDLRNTTGDLKQAQHHLDTALSKVEDAQDAVDDAQDAIDNAPATGAQHDRAVAAKARAVAAKARAQTAADDADNDRHDAQVDVNTATTAQAASQTAYNTAVSLRDSLKSDFNADITDRGVQKLAETAGQYGLELTLAETDTMRFGRPVNIGDRWPIDILGETVTSDRVREVELSDTVADGLVVIPSLGDGTSKPLKNLMRIVGNVVRKVSDRDSGR